MAHKPSGKSLSTDLWILLASLHVTLTKNCNQYDENLFADHVCSRLRRRLRLGRGVVGSVLVATSGSVHSTCNELQLLIIPQRLRLRLRLRLVGSVLA